MAENKRDPESLTPTEVRQGSKAHRISRVLVISVLLAAAVLAIVLAVFA